MKVNGEEEEMEQINLCAFSRDNEKGLKTKIFRCINTIFSLLIITMIKICYSFRSQYPERCPVYFVGGLEAWLCLECWTIRTKRESESMQKKDWKNDVEKTHWKRPKVHFSGICLSQCNHFNIMLPWDCPVNLVNFSVQLIFFFFKLCNPLLLPHFISISHSLSECPKCFGNFLAEHHHHQLKPTHVSQCT